MEEIALGALIDTVVTCSSAGKRYCFILGAGASIASGIKTGTEMAKDWLKEMERDEPKALQEWVEKNKIDKSDPGRYYSKIYEQRFRLDPAGGFIRLQNEMKDAIPSPGYYYLAEIIYKTQNKLVITTNFDSLTEDSLFIYKNQNALVITHESLAKYIDALSSRPTIIKLHRDLLLQPKSAVKEVNALSKEWKNSLKKILDIYVPLVIGYGGNDGSLMGFLENIDTPKDRILYWCYKRGNPVNERIKNLLEKYHGFLIPIEDFDDTMCIFGDHFGYKYSKETIRKVTNERAESLISKYNEWIENRRNSLETMETLSDTEGMTYASFKSLSERNISEFEKRITNEPKSPINYNGIGDEYFFQKDYNKAIEYYIKAIELDPNNAEYYHNCGASYHRLKEYEKAIANYTKAIELEPDNAKFYHNRGVNYNRLNEYEKAIEDHTKAIELEPDNAEFYSSRGISYDWLKEYEKAIVDISKATELKPDNAKYYLYLARVLCRTSDFDNALINLNKAMSLDNKLPACYNTRGFIGVKRAKQCKTKCKSYVLENLNKAIELINDDSLANMFYRDRAEYYLYSNEPDKAFDDLQKSISLYNKDGLSYFLLARYYEMKGNIQEYERCWNKMKEYRYIPDNSDY